MITKINKIKSVGRFEDCTPKASADFKKTTLIYAENGRGKTSFCSILRSLKTGTSDFILGRATLGSSAAPEVILQSAAGNHIFKDGAWSAQLSEIEVFDETYINENVYSSEGVGQEHKKKLHQIIIGEEGVTLAKKYEEAELQTRKASEAHRIAEQALTAELAAVGITLANALKATPPVDSAKKIEAAERELASVTSLEEIRQARILSLLTLPKVKLGVMTTLKRNIEGIATDVATRVETHAKEHNMDDRGQAWLAKGLQYTSATDTCPFCDQDLSKSELHDQIKSFFSQEYTTLKADVDAAYASVSENLSAINIQKAVTTINNNAESHKFWSRHLDKVLPTLDAAVAEKALTELRTQYFNHILRKQGSILELIEEDALLTAATASVTALIADVEEYNKGIEAYNAAIEEKKRHLGTLTPATIKSQIERLKAEEDLHGGKLGEKLKAYTTLKEQKTAAETKKATAKTALDHYTKGVITKYEGSINKYLDLFNAGFTIGNTAHDYKGTGTPRTSFQIIINDTVVELSDSSSTWDKPGFKNTLSSGDKSTLALAFFLAQLEHNPNLNKTVVVLDDPFTSQDSFRRSSTIFRIAKGLRESAQQVIVLSHDAHFLYEIWEYLPAATRQSLIFGRQGKERTMLTEYNLEEAISSRTKTERDTLHLYHNEGFGTPLDVLRCIRPCIEGHFRRVHGYAPKANLDSVLADLRTTGDTHVLYDYYEDLNEINDYTAPYMHAEDPKKPYKIIDEAELNGYVKRALKIANAS